MHHDAGRIRIDVADTGVGIRPESLPGLFTEFYREKRAETRHIEGNGPGLTIVKRLTERVGGRVRVSTVLDQGSTFSVTLPVFAQR